MDNCTEAAFTALVSLALLGCSATETPPPPNDNAQTAASTFVAADFEVPKLVETEGFKLVPLGPDLTEVDYEAYMSSIEHLQATFTRTTDWPHPGLTMDDAVKDMKTEAARFAARTSFAYAVLTPDGSRERGCVYVYPGADDTGGEYDAVVRLWVTKAEFNAGFDEELYAWTQEWLAQDWPFSNVAYPGRAIAWEKWDALTAKADGA